MCSMEAGTLSGKALTARVLTKKPDSSLDLDSTSSAKGIQIDDKLIKQAAQNAVVISVLTLREPKHQRLVNLICAVSCTLTQFHTDQNKASTLSISTSEC